MTEETLNRIQEVEQTMQECGFENYLVSCYIGDFKCTVCMLRENQNPKEINLESFNDYMHKSEIVISECENGEWVVVKCRQCVKKPFGTLAVILSNLRTYNFS